MLYGIKMLIKFTYRTSLYFKGDNEKEDEYHSDEETNPDRNENEKRNKESGDDESEANQAEVKERARY